MGGKPLKSNANEGFVSYAVHIVSYVENVIEVEGLWWVETFLKLEASF